MTWLGFMESLEAHLPEPPPVPAVGGWVNEALCGFTGEAIYLTTSVRKGGARMGLLLLIIVIVLLIAALPTWPYSSGWGYYPGGGLGVILIILLVLIVLGIL